ncbi:hypothetical protein LTR37_008973 [Vermiconidia calcicola]|uniref:Uncharacterized protein n=1 Tax=Vermiconidia calcicola TaxID=1690605 RepID=A0ACC3N9N0_9PEZI|nr:hypothetical protein LTR37_008973 [Vermiconidia calcicola]
MPNVTVKYGGFTPILPGHRVQKKNGSPTQLREPSSSPPHPRNSLPLPIRRSRPLLPNHARTDQRTAWHADFHGTQEQPLLIVNVDHMKERWKRFDRAPRPGAMQLTGKHIGFQCGLGCEGAEHFVIELVFGPLEQYEEEPQGEKWRRA